MTRRFKVDDPVIAGERPRRRYCLWIANKWCHRCPRPAMKNEECWCRLADARVDDPKWPWRVVPPLAGVDGPAWSYDNTEGPVLCDDEATRRWLRGAK
jgi:hypothetical protein